MYMKISKLAFAHGLALASSIYYVTCYVLALIAPQFFLDISASWFHMIDIEKIGKATATSPLIFFSGLVTLAISAWLFGYVLGWSIELFSKKK